MYSLFFNEKKKLFLEFNFEHSLSAFLIHGHSSHYPKGLPDTHSRWSFVLSGSQFSVRIGRGFLPANTDENLQDKLDAKFHS